VILQHSSDKLILNFGDTFESSYKTTEECEPQQDLFINIANEPTVNSLKIIVATDYVLRSGNNIITRLNLNLRPSDLAEYCFIEKDSFLRPRGLICVGLPFLQNGHYYIRIKNIGHRRIFVIVPTRL